MLKKKLSNALMEESGATKKSNLADINVNTAETSKTTVSKYFSNPELESTLKFEERFLRIQKELNTTLEQIIPKFELPVAYVYNPLEYAWLGNEMFVRKYIQKPKKVLFVGMNPGPFGMCQTGVPFGAIKNVRDWLGICCPINKPPKECPKRPIQGFQCKRNEISGDRFWGLLEKLAVTPDRLFRHTFIYNYCPLAMMKENGENITPNDLKKNRKELETICDEFYLKIIDLVDPEIIIAVGGYVRDRSRFVLKSKLRKPQVLYLIHPSPRVPNNQDWSVKAELFFKTHKIIENWQ